MFREDLEAIFERDPAAKSVLEVLLCYPGLHAVWLHRINHTLWKMDFPTIARFLSQVGRFFTGIEIHPAAQIGRRLFIDHGMGVVIGETTVIGDDVTLYQAVTLGGTGKEKGKRHPTLEDGVVVGAGAKILGGITIGHHSQIGASSVVLKDVPPEATVVGVPARVVTVAGERVCPPVQPDDPVMEQIEALEHQVQALQEALQTLLHQHESHAHQNEDASAVLLRE